ncbi:hypothetical protein [Mesorhizobium sp. ANAO-SY3R2]|uniref:hypothetical protein n=1 Tax=Mesorhizobium sp. ANAO-SY3R2 TaxID=3166644 RepID=UPI003670C689
MTSRNKHRPISGTTADVQRKLMSETNMRLLHAFPAFGVESSLPDKLLNLLDRLDDSEQPSQSQKSN